MLEKKSFENVREIALWDINEDVRRYENSKIKHDSACMEMYSRDAFQKVLFSRTIGLISSSEADEYFVKIDKEYLLNREA